ncbi:YppF family protein [Aquibacillus saliphilus]|uniref:YppF family protein n=1 Tax=Aquibacillus saliphilus TaxID=1909422 RepID=UPI001CF09941|nr:YppF family protein [Aquibacillus saliphilus]
MDLKNLISLYTYERNHEPNSIDQLLDFCQQIYIRGEIDIYQYRIFFQHLHNDGAISCHEQIT